MSTVRVPEISLLLEINKLKEISSGGEGTIYEIDNDWALKIFHDPWKQQAEKIKILEKAFSQKEKLWVNLRSVATVPEYLVRNEDGKIIGYLMKNCQGWNTLNCLYDGQTKIKDVLGVFIKIHNALCAIHENGLTVGDLNGKNIIYSGLEKDQPQIRIVDLDNLTINRPDIGINFCPLMQDPEVIHPDHLKAQKNGTPLPSFLPKHDWWIFAYLLTKCLTGSDPFEQGNFMNLDISDMERRQEGLLAMHKGINLGSPIYYSLYLRIGIPLKHFLKRWLSRSEEGIFPINLLENTMQEMMECPSCKKEINGRLTICPFPNCEQLL